MTFTTDNRWSPGSSGATVPETATAAYAARWIDHDGEADMLPDRQGVAFVETADRERLYKMLGEEQPHLHYKAEPYDVSVCIVDRPDGEFWVRRAGGYVYVDAWVL